MSTLPPYGDVLAVRPEVLDDIALLDMVNLALVGQTAPRGLAGKVPGTALASDPERFFDLTYPTADITDALRVLADRRHRPLATPGTILLSGRYGTGKSHVLLAIYHALQAPEVLRAWARRWHLTGVDIMPGTRVVARSFVERTAENLWDAVFEALGRSDLLASVSTYPDGALLTQALDDTPTVLVFDELERWFHALDAKAQSRNINFIQALTEVSMRDPRLTLVTSVLGEHAEPAATIKRCKPLELAFASSDDRERVILYRLFSDHTEHDRRRSERVVDHYLDSYRRADLPDLDAYRERIRATYPFTPELMDILTRKVPQLGGFQNTRGTLRFLAKLVRATSRNAAIVSSAHIPLTDNDVQNDLRSLDQATGGEVVRRALGDNYRDVPPDLPLKDALFSTLLFYSVADPSRTGASAEQVLSAVLAPDDNPNRIRDALERLLSLAYNLHREDERFVFKAAENPHARINAVALSPRVTDDACREILIDELGKRWGDPRRTLVFPGARDAATLTATGRALRDLGRQRPKFLLSTRSLARELDLRLELQNLDEQRNLVLLIEPELETSLSGATFDLLADDDLLKRARRIEACNRLLESQPRAEARATYEEVRATERKRVQQRIAEVYGVYVAWMRAGATGTLVDDSWYELGHVDQFSAEAFLVDFARDYSNPVVVEHRLRELWRSYENRKVGQLQAHFERTPGEPVLHDEQMLARAVIGLVEAGVLALQDERGVTWTKRVRELSLSDLAACALVECPVTPPVTPVDRPLVHAHVSARYDEMAKVVRLEWQYPERPAGAGSALQTVVQRYARALGWQEGAVVPIEISQTFEKNRYVGDGTAFSDAEHLSAGHWYKYYVFLLEPLPGAPPRATLSRILDVRIPGGSTIVEANEIHIPSQPEFGAFYAEVERTVMDPKKMAAESVASSLTFELAHIGAWSTLETLRNALTPPGGSADIEGSLRVPVRGRFGRLQILEYVKRLPHIAGASYALRIRLEPPKER